MMDRPVAITTRVEPGAIQPGRVLAFVSGLLGSRPALRGLRAVKFQRRVQPGLTLRLTIRPDAEREVIRFAYESAAGLHSSGRVLLGGAGA